MIEDKLLRNEIILSVHRALIANVPNTLRAITCKINTEKWTFRAHFQKNATEEDIEDISCAFSEVAADFWNKTPHWNEEIVKTSENDEIKMLDEWLFLRSGEIYSNNHTDSESSSE